MDNTVPADPEVEEIKEEFRIPLRDLKSFDTLNGVLKQDKVKRMKLVPKKCYLTDYVLDNLIISYYCRMRTLSVLEVDLVEFLAMN